jgi:hypothetical protein
MPMNFYHSAEWSRLTHGENFDTFLGSTECNLVEDIGEEPLKV